ncbi:Wadjet anti-phage system protein JetD domain-containing protein [Brevibacillus sp. H7]|uniref:Wadjet anti-phage system protein JetD domain-containing protein n=1 Tax=Brevibacillus sp. H7 TaxID=3349138 RepID=UPI0037F43130
MYEKIFRHLQTFKNSKISLGQLEALADPDMTYTSFQTTIQMLLDNQVLKPVSKHGTNGKNPPLPLTYRIRKSIIAQSLKREIQAAQLRFHPSIKLDTYFSLSETRWNKDLPYIESINNYLTRHGVPQEEATAAERSFHLVGDEKWIDEKGGRKLLETIGIWDLLRITALPDPLMLAMNVMQFRESQNVYQHLIVENKTTFYAIQPILPSLPYATLIYGAGWKVVSGLENLPDQLGLGPEVQSRFEYFGDLDHEGIAIWHALFEKYRAVPAVDVYLGLLKQNPSTGKETQIVREEAVRRFVTFFSDEEGQRIQNLLREGKYLPQEALEAEILRDVMKQSFGYVKKREDQNVGL